MKEYRVKDTVRAEKVETPGNVVTHIGPVFAKEGDYLVYEENGSVTVWEDIAFELHFEAVENGDDDSGEEFHPSGHVQDEVLDYMRANPDQVERIKQEERDGGSRKGILNYEK